MESVGLYDFTATAEDELSFKKGEVVKILSMKEDNKWYKAELDGREGLIPRTYINMKPCSWYDDEISRQDAEAMLLKKWDGSFVVRNSSSSPGDFTLSVKFESGVQHFKVLRDGGGKYFLWMVKFDSLNQLVEYHRTSSVSREQQIFLRDKANEGEDGEKCVAKYDFKPEEEGELELKRGDIVTILEKMDSNWWRGTIRRESGTYEGIFPASYVSSS